jgi:Flp pilus assembly protein TadG
MTIRKDESGQASVFMILFMGIVMLGFLGFSVDVGYFFHEKRMAQAAADAAAVAAAEEDGYAGDSGNAQAAANAAATMNGFDTGAASNPATVTLTSPTSGNYSSQGSATSPQGWIQATVSKPVPGFFLSAFNHNSNLMTVSASATAGEGQVSSTCVCLEGPSIKDLNMSNNSKLTATGCGVTLDSNSSTAASIVGSASVNAQTLGSVSTNWYGTGNINNGGSVTSNTKVIEGLSTSCAPTMPAVPTYPACVSDPVPNGGGNKYTVGPANASSSICYNGLTVGGNGNTVTLNPGIYVINGGSLHFESGTNKGGTGVFFYLMNNAALTIDNGATPTLTSPSSGTYSGIVFWQAASDTQTLNVQGGSTMVLNGAIFAPGAGITMANGSGSTVSSDIVAQSLTMAGGGTLTSTAQINLGTLNISSAKVSQ